MWRFCYAARPPIKAATFYPGAFTSCCRLGAPPVPACLLRPVSACRKPAGRDGRRSQGFSEDLMEYDHEEISRRLAAVGEVVRNHVLQELRRQSSESLSAIAFETAADKIYVIDRSVETALLPALAEHLQPALSFALICEGLNDERPLIFPAGTPIDKAQARLIVDPIDGTRPIMYNKRSAWWLAGLAPNRGDETSLQDIDVAVQVEIPTTRAALADTLWAIRGRGAVGETTNLITGERTSIQPRPS